MDKLSTENQKHPERFPKIDQIELGSDGWLSPRGDYYKVGTTEHDESATYLTQYSSDVKDLVKKRYETYDLHRYDKLNSREKLKSLGFILIRGKTLRSEDVVNFTPEQLKKITDTGVKVVSAFEENLEYPAKEVLKKISSIAQGLQKIDVVLNLQEDLNNLRSGKRERAYDDQFKETTISDVKRFLSSPLKTTIKDDQLYDPKKHEILSTGIFDHLSKGYSDEMEMYLSRSLYRFRVVDMKHCKLLVVWENYSHDGLSGGMSGDINNYISMSIVDSRSAREKLSKLIDNKSGYGDVPKIKTKSDFFSKIISDITSGS